MDFPQPDCHIHGDLRANRESNTTTRNLSNINSCGNITCELQRKVFICGACSHSFRSICRLQTHLNIHGSDGSYFFDNRSSIAYPKYGSSCQHTQTDFPYWVENANDIRRTSTESDRYHSSVDNTLVEFIHTDSECIEQIMDEVLDDAKEITDEEECHTREIEGDLEHHIAHNDDDANSVFYDKFSICMKTIEEAPAFGEPSQTDGKGESIDLIKGTTNSTQRCSGNQEIPEKYDKGYASKKDECCSHFDVIDETMSDSEELLAKGVIFSSEMFQQIQKEHGPSQKKSFFKCNLCGKRLTTKEGMKRHHLVHSDLRPFSCSICKKSYRTKGELNSHKLSHSKSKNFICQLCGKTFFASHMLRYHITGCQDIMPFPCLQSNCGKEFRSKSALEIHTRSHTGESPYVCEYCGKSFTRVDSLSKHSYIHTGDKPCKCEVCHKTFTTKDHLKRHIRTHTQDKPFKCTYCDKLFSQSWNLHAHIRQHTGDKPYSCDICGKSFKHNVSCKKHMLKDHSSSK